MSAAVGCRRVRGSATFDQLRSDEMAKAKSPRTTKPTTKSRTAKNILQMPESGNGNTPQYSPADLEVEIRFRAYELYEQRGCTPGPGRAGLDRRRARSSVPPRLAQAHRLSNQPFTADLRVGPAAVGKWPIKVSALAGSPLAPWPLPKRLTALFASCLQL